VHEAYTRSEFIQRFADHIDDFQVRYRTAFIEHARANTAAGDDPVLAVSVAARDAAIQAIVETIYGEDPGTIGDWGKIIEWPRDPENTIS
jgi:hypothetical protein